MASLYLVIKTYNMKNKDTIIKGDIRFFNQRKLKAAQNAAQSDKIEDVLAEYEKLAGYYEVIAPKKAPAKKAAKKTTQKRATKKATK